MKRIACIILLAALLLCLCACAAQPEWKGYTGKPEEYRYYHETQREKAWEDDIISLAQQFLTDHPLLRNENHGYFNADQNVIWMNPFDQSRYDAFLGGINGLIPKLAQMKDAQILYALQRIVAALGDEQSQLAIDAPCYFPVMLEPFYVDTQVQLHITALPKEHKELLFCRLISINGIGIEEIMERLAPYASAGNAQCLLSRLTMNEFGQMLTDAGFLAEVGVLERADQPAAFVLLSEDGKEHTVQIAPVAPEDWSSVELESRGIRYACPLAYRNWTQDYHWYELWPEENTAYVRIGTFTDDKDESMQQMCDALIGEILENENVDRIIVDLRRCRSGYRPQGYKRLLQALQLRQITDVRVLIDGGTYTMGMRAAFDIRQKIACATLVGTPASQGSVHYANDSRSIHPLPNNGTLYYVGSVGYALDLQNRFDALQPDITVYPTLDDYKNQVDTILEAAKTK